MRSVIVALTSLSIATATLAGQEAAQQSSDPPGKGVWLNYDFIPGERPLFYEDFSSDDVGDFPRRLKLKEGDFQVVAIKGKKYLRTTTGGYVFIQLPETLPERFTVEVKYWASSSTNPLRFLGDLDGGGATFGCTHDGGWVEAENGPTSAASGDSIPDEAFVDCRFTIDTKYIKAYHNTKRVANNPSAVFPRGKVLLIQIPGYDEGTLVTDIRVAAGGKKLYDLLSANGRVATQGILFDFGSDRIRGESTPTLKEIADMLQQHAELKLTIEGHTDNVGAAAANLTLSEKRAAAVKKMLVDVYKIDPARLLSKGFGATKPAASNDSPEGRQANRRVELVKN